MTARGSPPAFNLGGAGGLSRSPVDGACRRGGLLTPGLPDRGTPGAKARRAEPGLWGIVCHALPLDSRKPARLLHEVKHGLKWTVCPAGAGGFAATAIVGRPERRATGD
jgi:hypothetical protein